MKFIHPALLFIFFPVFLFSQDSSRISTDSSAIAHDTSFAVEHIRATWKESHFFQTFDFTALTYYSRSPVFTTHETNGTEVKYNVESLCLIAFTYEPRINLKDHNERSSFSINFPVTLGIALTFSDTSKYDTYGYNKITNGGFLELPLLLHYNHGFHSTFFNDDLNGFTIGLGGQVIVAPLIVTNGLVPGQPRAWALPVFKVGYKRDDDRFQNVRNLDLTLGYFNGLSFKFSFGYIF